MSHPVVPIEVRLGDGTALRGHEHSQDGPPVVFVHDLDDDLDAWEGIPAMIADRGFRSMTLELRGHGLSDGEPDPNTTIDDLREALQVISESFGPLGLAAYGTVASTALLLGLEDHAPVHVLVSPLPYRDTDFDPDATVAATRALFVGSKDQDADGHVRSIFPRLRGQNMWFSTGLAKHGVGLLAESPQFIEQAAMFFRRYLTGFHLAWLAGHQVPADTTGDAPRRSAGF